MKRVLLLALLLAGCAQLPQLGSAGQPADILAYAQRYGELPAEAQKKEHALVSQALSRNKNDVAARMKAALIYGLPASRYRDGNRALSLLNEIQRDSSIDATTRALADVLKDYVSERQKLEEQAARLGQKAAEEQKRADSLQQKLDALKNIEKALTERGQTGQK